MKRIILLAFFALAFANGYSQKEGGFRVGLDLGYVPSDGGGGILFSMEPKYNITDNMNIGLRMGSAAIIRDIQYTDSQPSSAKVAANASFVGTYDYYLHKSGNSFVPYFGVGVGYYSIANVEANDSNSGSTTTAFSPTVSGVMGGLVRGGFEWGKFRMGLEYNIVPDSTLQDINGISKGTVANSYLGIHLGFFIGGGKWGE